ncbi:MAG: Tat pathway signal protein [Betaproteobacteria bacterium]|nr:Tat pathway signal protein [Betaproteobacteria bacterium]
MRSPFKAATAALALVAAVAGAPVLAQEAYPAHPVTVVVPFPPGGVAELTGRPATIILSKLLKQPFVLINKPGAGGSIGAAAVTTARPDGYTLLMALASVSTNPEADKMSGRPPAFQLDQLAPIALVSADPVIAMVRADSPYKTLKDLVEDAKKRPEAINYSSSGNYGTYHVATEMFTSVAGIKMKHIPYAGGGPALTALLGGQVDVALLGPSVAIAQIKAGKLRPLASWGGKRIASLPEVPTLKELGYNVEYYIWSGLFAPTGTPEPVMKTLREAMRKVVADEEFKATMAKLETPIVYMDAPEFKKFWDDDAKRLIDVVRKIGKIE